MHRHLAGLEAIRVCRIEREVRAAILQHYARYRIGDAGAEDTIEAEDERRRVAVGIDGRDVHRVAGEAALRHLIPGERARRVDELAALARMRLRDEPRQRHLGMAWIGKPAVAIVIGELLRLHEQVYMIRAVVRAELERLDEIQHLEHAEALRRGRRFVNGDPAVAAADRLAPTA